MAAQSTSRRSMYAACAAALTVTTLVAVTRYLRAKKASERHKSTKQPFTKKIRVDRSDEVDPQVERLFEVAATESKKLTKISNTEKLILYSLYKQSKEGDAPENTPGFRINIVEKAKYSAWERVRGMSRMQAMIHYIEGVQQLMQHGSLDTDMPDFDGADDLPMDGGGLGNKPSTLAFSEEDLGYGSNGEELTLEQKMLKAASENDVAQLQSILKFKPELVNHRDDDGQSALHLAADKSSMDALKILLTSGADKNAADGDGITVLHAAVIAENVEACKVLLEHGANPDQTDVDGDTPRKCAEEDGTKEMKAVFALYKKQQ